MTDPNSATQRTLPSESADPATYGPYAQLVKMLVPSSGCIAIYDTDGELLWCSDGYERPDLRELMEELRDADPGSSSRSGKVRQTSDGMAAYAATLTAVEGTSLGFVAIHLGAGQSAAKSGSMAPSLLRPVLECLAARIRLEKAASEAQPSPTDDLARWLALDTIPPEGAPALQRLIEHCIEHLRCISGAFLVPEKGLHILASRLSGAPEAARLLSRTEKHLLAWAQLNNRPMIVNRVGSDAGVPPYKILSCPVHDTHGRVTGLIALFRSGEAPNFEIRDVRILELVGRKAVGILDSQHDPLTGLMSRSIFEQYARKAMDSGNSAHARMLHIDIDRLQSVNDAFGFHAGDEVIQHLAQLVRDRLGAGELACRLGGDRFAVFMPARSESAARQLAAGIIETMCQFGYMRATDALSVSASIGLASAQQSFEQLLAAAELACKRARQMGGSRLETYGPNAQGAAVREGETFAAAALQQALQSNEFRLQAQAIVDLYKEPGKVLGYEVLVRMREPSGALLSPDKFIDAAQRYGLMSALDKWVLGAAVRALQVRGGAFPEWPLGISLNVSAQSLATPDFAAFALAEIERAGLPSECFCFEVRESVAVSCLAEAETFIRTLTSAGCHVALDRFGRGLSSLAYLKRLKVSYLKIDGDLSRRVLDDVHAASLVRGIAQAAQTLGVLTVAEHVESAAHAEKLQELEVDLAQGYHYGHPLALERVLEETVGEGR